MNKVTLPTLCLLSATFLACGGQEIRAAEVPAEAQDLGAERDLRGLSTAANGESFAADFSSSTLDAQHWVHQPTACSKLRNACTDADPARTQLRGDGKLTLSATAARAAHGDQAKSPARFPSLDWIHPKAQVVAGKCIELTVTFPQSHDGYGGVVLAPEPGAAFAGQLYVASASAGLLRLGLACTGSNGSISFARPTDAAFLRAPHTLRLCADAQAASFEVDGELWAEVVEEELADACGSWPFGSRPSPLHAHFVVAPAVGPEAASEAMEMVIEKLAVTTVN